jgi:hypothetical protein
MFGGLGEQEWDSWGMEEESNEGEAKSKGAPS